MAASGAGEIRSTGGVMRALAAGCVGNFVEWYDFAIYSYSVTIIATLFFPAGNRAAAIIAAFALYGVAFLARPVGGLFWGSLGDRIGRRNTLAVIVLIMGGATMLIGLLPTYGTIGIMAPVLLALLRLVQGFSGDGEFTGSTSFHLRVRAGGAAGSLRLHLGDFHHAALPAGRPYGFRGRGRLRRRGLRRLGLAHTVSGRRAARPRRPVHQAQDGRDPCLQGTQGA
jgi:hypothetical protein